MLRVVRVESFSRLKQQFLTRTLTTAQFTTDVIKKYGRDVIVQVPRLNEAVQFPVPPLHRSYDKAWRMAAAWSCEYLERQEDAKLLAKWDVAYLLGWMLPHCNEEVYLMGLRLLLASLYVDGLYSERWSAKEKHHFGKELMMSIQKLKVPSNAQFKSALEMVLQPYEELQKNLLTPKQRKELTGLMTKTIVAELLPPNREHQVDIKKYSDYKADASCARVGVWFIQSLSGYSMPDSIKKHPDIRKLLDLSNDLIWMPNDLVSFKREQSFDDHWDNYITVYARQNSMSLQQGVEKLIEEIDGSVVEFQKVMRKIVDSSLASENPGLKKFLEVGLANLIYGFLQCHTVAGKYSHGDTVYLLDASKNAHSDRIDSKQLYSRLKS